MATLWRGIVGPDLTVYVKALDTGGDREAAEELGRFGGVECRWDVGAVVVRVGVAGAGKGQGDGGNGEPAANVVEEKTLRRLGFEVLECVRGGGGGGGGGRAGFGRGEIGWGDAFWVGAWSGVEVCDALGGSDRYL